MDRFTMYPIAFITTVQPWVAAWVLAISFFVTMLIVALLSKGRTLKQVLLMSVAAYFLTTIVVGVSTSVFSGLEMVSLEVITVEPSTAFQD